MPRFDFTITIDQYVDDLNAIEAVYARLDDVSLFNSSGLTYVAFHRTAANLDDAIRSAISDLRSFGYAIKQIEVEPQCVGA
jgi:hypothetical protein